MSMLTELPCRRCGVELTLDCDVVDLHDSRKLDLRLTCENCDAPALYYFIPLADLNEVTA